jgi:hypothetical protein
MKSELANQLKNLLDNMSQEEFDRQWSEITAIGFDGPSFADILQQSCSLSEECTLLLYE